MKKKREVCPNCGGEWIIERTPPMPENPTLAQRFKTYWGSYKSCANQCGAIKLVVE